jgi:hypothetical protein
LHGQQRNVSLLFPFFICSKQTEIAVFPFVPFSFCSRVSSEVDFWNSVDVIVFTELVLIFTSAEFHVQNSTKWTWHGTKILGNFEEEKNFLTKNGSPGDLP